MKYEPIDKKTQRELIINSFEGGMNTSLPANCIEDNELSECVNVWYRDGILQKRPGLTPDISKIIWQEDVSSFDIIKYKLYDNTVFYDNTEYKVLTVIHSDAYSFERHNIFLISHSGEYISMGALQFGRTDANTFYLPESIVFFSGRATSGIGLYAMVTTYNSSDYTMKDYHIYEAVSYDSDWVKASEYYQPTVYINGRGNRYEFAQQSASAVTDSPSAPESVNMLNGSFRAFFSSDGYSSVFRLPIMDIDPDSAVKCRVYLSPTAYVDWTVAAGEVSATQQFYNNPITASVDRSKGIISFSGADGEEYPVPAMSKYRSNNICISSCKRNDDGFKDIVSCSVCGKSGTALLFSGGNKNSLVYCSRIDNPLYFPQNSAVYVGDSGEKITALTGFKGKILAFKTNRIYKINISGGERSVKNKVLTDSDNEYFEPYTLRSECISECVGTNLPSTVCLCADSLVWLGSDNTVYKTDSLAAESIKNISFKIQAELNRVANEFTPIQTACFASAADGNYILFFGSKAFILNFSVKGLRYPSYGWKTKSISCGWFYFEFTDKTLISGVFEAGGNIVFICGDPSVGICYIANFEGKKDCIYTGENTVEYPILCTAATKLYDMGNILTKKFIEKIDISAFGEMKVEYLSPSVSDEYKLISEDFNDLYIPQAINQRLLAGKGVRMFGVRFKSEKDFRLHTFSVKYRPAAF